MDTLTMLSSFTGGLDSFGEAAQYWGQASALDANAGIMDLTAKGVLQEGEERATAISVAGDKIIARQRAMYAKAGVTFTGTPASVWAESEKNLRMDILGTRLNYANKANEIGFQALQARIAAGNAKTAAIAAAGRGILNIVSTAALSSGTTGVRGGVAPTAKQSATFGGSYPGATPKGYSGTIQPF